MHGRAYKRYCCVEIAFHEVITFLCRAKLTIRPVSVIWIQVVGCRSMVAAWYPTLLHIGVLPATAQNFKFSHIRLSKREFLSLHFTCFGQRTFPLGGERDKGVKSWRRPRTWHTILFFLQFRQKLKPKQTEISKTWVWQPIWQRDP